MALGLETVEDGDQCYQFKSWHLVIKSVIWKFLWPKENFMILAWY